jgi:FkbM family methyltransferase
MNSAKQTAKRLLSGVGLSRPARKVFHTLFNRRMATWEREMSHLYGQFISDNDLVFDVGANVGEHSSLFLRLGARVVAVEPNPDCLSSLRANCAGRRLWIENVAVGSAVGTGVLRLTESSLLSSMSTEWVSRAKEAPRLRHLNWDSSLEVPVVTLDSLVDTYGLPQYIKIDVEGFEPEVVGGLSHWPRTLSFEYHSEYLAAAFKVCERIRGHLPEFNVLQRESTSFVSPRWMTEDELARFLETTTDNSQPTYGDIFARRS